MCGGRALDRGINNQLFFKALPPAHAITSVGVIKGVTTIRCGKAEVSACLHGGDVLERGLVLGIDVLTTAK